MSNTTQKFGKVMIIDDSKIDLYVNTQVIARSNFGKDVLQFASAVKALEYLQLHEGDFTFMPEVIFVDIYMPEMSGFEFMLAYDRLPGTLKAYCSVYIISSSIDIQDINRAEADANVIAFYQKPLSRAFLETIAK